MAGSKGGKGAKGEAKVSGTAVGCCMHGSAAPNPPSQGSPPLAPPPAAAAAACCRCCHTSALSSAPGWCRRLRQQPRRHGTAAAGAGGGCTATEGRPGVFKLTSCYSRYLAGVPHKAQLALRLHLAHMQRSRAWPASTHATGRWPSLSHCSAACSICHAPQIRRYLLQRVQAAEAAAAAAASAAPAATGAAGSSAEGSGGQEGGTAASGAAATAFLQLLDEASVRQSDVRVAIRRAAREQGLPPKKVRLLGGRGAHAC